jgi:hypothetical protein
VRPCDARLAFQTPQSPTTIKRQPTSARCRQNRVERQLLLQSNSNVAISSTPACAQAPLQSERQPFDSKSLRGAGRFPAEDKRRDGSEMIRAREDMKKAGSQAGEDGDHPYLWMDFS